MLRTVFALAAAIFVLVAVSGTSQAAPIAPLTSGVTTDTSGVTPVYYYYHRGYYRRHWRRCYWRYGYRHCW
jgi:hypothetical protein